MKKVIIIFYSIVISLLILTNTSICNYYPGSEEYEKRKIEADEIINSISTENNFDNNTDYRDVYVTTNDSKFHSYGCDKIKNTPHKMNVTEAQEKGYAPCKICNPFGLAGENKNNGVFKNIIIVVLPILFIIYVIINELRFIKYKKQS